MDKSKKYTVAGTDIDAVRSLIHQSGLSYNEAKEWIAKNMGGKGTNVFSDTDVESVKKEIHQSENNKTD